MKIFLKTHGMVLYKEADITDKITAFCNPTDSHFKLWTQYRMSQDTYNGILNNLTWNSHNLKYFNFIFLIKFNQHSFTFIN